MPKFTNGQKLILLAIFNGFNSVDKIVAYTYTSKQFVKDSLVILTKNGIINRLKRDCYEVNKEAELPLFLQTQSIVDNTFPKTDEVESIVENTFVDTTGVESIVDNTFPKPQSIVSNTFPSVVGVESIVYNTESIVENTCVAASKDNIKVEVKEKRSKERGRFINSMKEIDDAYMNSHPELLPTVNFVKERTNEKDISPDLINRYAYALYNRLISNDDFSALCSEAKSYIRATGKKGYSVLAKALSQRCEANGITWASCRSPREIRRSKKVVEYQELSLGLFDDAVEYAPPEVLVTQSTAKPAVDIPIEQDEHWNKTMENIRTRKAVIDTKPPIMQ
jgi:hypothetical protein